MILRFVVLFALASILLIAKQQQPPPIAVEPEFENLSQLCGLTIYVALSL
jgi:hypothetical protein